MPALVMTNARMFCRSPASKSFVRSARKCSHSGERGEVTAKRCGSTRAVEITREENSTARADPTAPKVAPASREAGPPGSAGPPVASSVCAVDAELKPIGTAVNGETSHGCSACLGTKYETLSALPVWLTEEVEERGADSARFSASYTLPIVSSPVAGTAVSRAQLVN